jgi:type IV pilus assembly protein PilE
MKTNEKKRSGFTIIELMIVIGIVALLVSLAYPAYSQYVRKARRGEAQQLLLNWSINQEIWRSSNTIYADTDDLPEPTHDDYVFSASNISATTYTLQAEARNDQVNDKSRDGSTYCGKLGEELGLNQAGEKSPATCWD